LQPQGTLADLQIVEYRAGPVTDVKSAALQRARSVTRGKPRVAGGAKVSLVGTTERADGRLQVTHNHHPLYTFVKDAKPGQTSGEGLDAFGAEWYALSPPGAKVDKDDG
jgi:hypothetical protein